MSNNILRIDPGSIVFPPTFINNTSKLTVKIYNDGDQIVRYEWRKNSDLVQDYEEIAQFDQMNPEERKKMNKILLFKSSVFQIDPIESQIWPHRFQQIVLTFSPTEPGFQHGIAYLYDKISKKRYPIHFNGVALPAEACFSVDTIHIGHVEIGNVFDYKIALQNTGYVECNFEFIEKSTEGLVIDFTPKSGRIEAGASVPIFIHFEATKVGQFNEEFSYRINNATEGNPVMNLYGKVLGPSYSIDTHEVDFGATGFGFCVKKAFEVENTSGIPLNYEAKMIVDGSFEKREFQIIPDCGTIDPHSTKPITIEFLPNSLKTYSVKCQFTATDLDEKSDIIIITGSCVCPDITLEEDEINLEDVFVGDKIPWILTAVNKSLYPAKYEMVDCSDPSVLEANITYESKMGIIEARGKTKIPIYITPKMVGPIRLNRFIKIHGSDYPDVLYTIKGHCSGPKIIFSEMIMDFGNINVLNDNTRSLLITNSSTIPAHFTAYCDAINTCFRIGTTDGTILAGNTLDFKVTAFFIDTLSYEGTINFYFDNLQVIQVKCKGKGTGCPILASIDTIHIDLGVLFTNQPIDIPFTLENFGQRNQEIKWSVKRTRGDTSPDSAIVKIEPSSAFLKPDDEPTNFILTIICNSQCKLHQTLCCQSLINRKLNDLFSPDVSATFINPTITFSVPKMEFKHIHNAALEEEHRTEVPKKDLLLPITIKNSIKNDSELPIGLDATASEYFAISKYHFELLPGESEDFDITFLVDKKSDFISEKIDSKIIFQIDGNSQTIALPTVGSWIFPNIQLSAPSVVDFGIVQKDTEMTRDFEIMNTSSAVAHFCWEVIDHTHLFDIYPMRGTIMPGEIEEFHITFFARIEGNVKREKSASIVNCHVASGPDYSLTLKGVAAELSYEVTPKEINFPVSLYTKLLHSQILIENTGPMPVTFSVAASKSCQFKNIRLDPPEGLINPGEHSSLNLTINPGSPKEFEEVITLTIGKYDTVPIIVKADCCIEQLMTDIPRHPEDPLLEALEILPKRVDVSKHFSMSPPEQLLEIDPGCNTSYESLSSIERSFIVDRLLYAPVPSRAKVNPANAFVVSRFLVEMGTILLGENRKGSFLVQNSAPIPISFFIDDTNIKGTGLSIDPVVYDEIPPGLPIMVNFMFESDKHPDDMIGDVEIPVRVQLSDLFCYEICISMSLIAPAIMLSHTSFVFDLTIVGQSRTMTLQLQNMNSIPTQYEFGEAAPLRILQQKKAINKGIFTVSPTSGTIAPHSFQNIVITFRPKGSRNYSMQIPLKTAYNEDITYVFVKGVGTRLSVTFDPPKLTFGPIAPFSGSQTKLLRIINPTSHAIEVFSSQFDSQLLAEQTRPATPAQMEAKNDVITFSVCVIVHGPPHSGRTTLSKALAKHLGNLPVICLKSVIADGPAALHDMFIDPSMANGFIIDGLDGIPHTETDLFFQHIQKQKQITEELAKNHLTEVPHSPQTSYEHALEILLGALSGHYVFLVGIEIDEASIERNIKASKEEEEEIARLEKELENLEIDNMTEEEYNNLSEIEKKEIDEKRNNARKNTIKQLTPVEEVFRKSRAGTRIKQDTPIDKTPLKSLMKSRKRFEISTSNLISIFSYTIGSLAKMVQEERDNFNVVNPSELQLPNAVKFGFDEPQPSGARDRNVILVNGSKNLKDLIAELMLYFPRWNVMRERIFMKHIEPPRLIMAESAITNTAKLDPMPEFFQILSVNIPIEEPPEQLSSSSRSRGRRKIDSKKSNTKLVPSTSQTNVDLEVGECTTRRWQIQPNDTEIMTVKFIGQQYGTYVDSLIFKIVGGNGEQLICPVEATISYPDIERDPTVIFGKSVNKQLIRTEFAYVKSSGEFTFGAQIALKDTTVKSGFSYKHLITIRNTTEIQAEVNISVDTPKGIFSVEQSTIILDPGQQDRVNICFHPNAVDKYKGTLLICVKDNPDPISFVLNGEGVIPNIEITHQTLDFGKTLVNSSNDITVTLNNTGKAPAYWKLKGTQAVEGVTFSPMEGLLMPKNQTDISCVFSSKKPLVIKKPIQVDVMDKNKVRMFNAFHIQVLAEAFDVDFDIIYPRGTDHVQFGLLKVGHPQQVQVGLKNRGKYPALFKIIRSRSAASKTVTFSHSEGTVNPGDKNIFNVTFTFTSDTPIKYDRATMCFLRVIDTVTQKQMMRIPMMYSAQSDYCKFEIEPPFVNFGVVPLNEQNTMSIQMKNTGVFPIDLSIDSNDTSSRFRKRPGVKKIQKSRSRLGNPLYAGNFTLTPANAQIQPGEVLNIVVEHMTTVPADENTSVRFSIPDTISPYLMYQLKAIASLPEIEADDFSKIFPDTMMCLRYDIVRTDTSCFLEDDQLFHFQSTIVRQKKDTHVVIINKFPVPITVDVNVKPKSKSDANKFPFYVLERILEIGCYDTATVNLIFAPEKTGTFNGVFEAIPRSTTKETPRSLRFDVEGTASVPQIEIVGIEKQKGKGTKYDINIGRAPVGGQREKSVCVKNVGTIPARVSVTAPASPDFFIKSPDTSHEVVLGPGRQFDIVTVFAPEKQKKSNFDVSLSVVDSPVDYVISFTGECTSEDLVIEGMNDEVLNFPDTLLGRPISLTFSIRNVTPLAMRYAFEDVPDFTFSPKIGHLHAGATREITATFVSDKSVKKDVKGLCRTCCIIYDDYNAPEWDDTMKTTRMIPRAVYEAMIDTTPKNRLASRRSSVMRRSITPRKSQSILRTNSKSSRLSDSSNGHEVHLTPRPPGNNLGQVMFDNDLVPFQEPKEEPSYHLPEPLRMKDVAFKLIAVADNVNFTISEHEFSYAPTMMYESRTYVVTLRSLCDISMEYQWYVRNFTSMHQYEMFHQIPFYVEPSSGVIGPREEKEFRLKFTPEEVDHFTADLFCDINHARNDREQTVTVSGSSRRPICHLALESSDYLERRHPGYTYAIPDETKVLEMFASKIGVRTTKKFEIINTMDLAYDVIIEPAGGATDEAAITCETNSALIAGGRRFQARFTYTPDSVRTIERLFRLRIPLYSTTVFILVVGRIMPN